MLVYLKEPMGYQQIDGMRIYGRYYCRGKFGAVDMDLDTYKKNIDILEQAEYTRDWLENKFGKKFPDISFTIDGLRHFEDRELKNLAILVGINFKEKWGTPALDIKAKNALIKSITLALNNKL